jgi:hypothetical protein
MVYRLPVTGILSNDTYIEVFVFIKQTRFIPQCHKYIDSDGKMYRVSKGMPEQLLRNWIAT